MLPSMTKVGWCWWFGASCRSQIASEGVGLPMNYYGSILSPRKVLWGLVIALKFSLLYIVRRRSGRGRLLLLLHRNKADHSKHATFPWLINTHVQFRIELDMTWTLVWNIICWVAECAAICRHYAIEERNKRAEAKSPHNRSLTSEKRAFAESLITKPRYILAMLGLIQGK